MNVSHAQHQQNIEKVMLRRKKAEIFCSKQKKSFFFCFCLAYSEKKENTDVVVAK